MIYQKNDITKIESTKRASKKNDMTRLTELTV